MASVKRRGRKWEVRWRETVSRTADGKRVYRWRSRTAPTERAAKAIRRQVEEPTALGVRWTPPAETVSADLTEVFSAYVDHMVRSGRSDSLMVTVAVTGELLWSGLGHRGGRPLPANVLTADLLDRLWAAGEQAASPGRATAHVRRVEAMWAWAYNRGFRGVPPPRKLDGLPDYKRVFAPSPTWAEVDAVITRLVEQRGWDPLARACMIARCTGLRFGSVVALRWRHVDLKRGTLTVPPNHPGAKTPRARMGWQVPVAPVLLDELRSWERSHADRRIMGPDRMVTTLRAMRLRLKRHWEHVTDQELVRRPVWAPEGRYARPTHGFRAA